MPCILRDCKIVQYTDAPRQTYPWLKLFIQPDAPNNPEHRLYYFSNMLTQESRWNEPEDGFWLWNYSNSTIHAAGLQETTPKEKREEPIELSSLHAR
jgi:adenine specific DNA methylase Mod